MRYLGGLRGVGKLTHDGKALARAAYELDEFFTKPGLMTGTGEIRMTYHALQSVFGRKDLKLLTSDGRSLSLRFTENRLRPATTIAHVSVAGGIAAVPGEGRRQSKRRPSVPATAREI